MFEGPYAIPRRTRDLSGNLYGRLTVMYFNGKDKNNHATWRVRCDCGKEKVVLGTNLTAGLTNSCGCLRVDTQEKMKSIRNRKAKP